MMVKVGAVVAGVVIFAVVDVQGDAAGDLMGACDHGVGKAGAFAVHIPGTLHLVGGGGGAPQEVFRESFELAHGGFSL